MKLCKKCLLTKPFTEFSKHNRAKDKLQYQCNPCRAEYKRERNKLPEVKLYKKEYNKKWKLENQDKIDLWYKNNSRKKRLKSKFNLTLEQYDQMLLKQNSSCAICSKHQNNFKFPLYVDHNHSTNKIRGLLCHRCNVAIGLFDDSLINLSKAIEYLKKDD